MSAEEAQRKSLRKLRLSHFHRTDNKAEKRWQQIDQMNHLADAVAASFRGEPK